MMKKVGIFIIMTGFYLVILTFGCAPPAYRAHPELEMRTANIKSPYLVPPDIKIYELTAGGVRELKDEWCSKGKENVLKSLMDGFEKKHFDIKMLPVDRDIEEEMEDIQALYRAVSYSILTHTYNQQFIFPEKLKNFDYSVGPVDSILKKYNADAFLFVYGIDEISTGGRQALTAAGVILGAFTGIVVIPRAGITSVSIALVDASGTVVWFNVKGGAGGYDLRDEESCTNLIKNMLVDFPVVRK